MNGRLAPTKGNLIMLKEELALAREAYELLDRKREVLINELMRYMHDLRQVQDRFHAEFGKGLESLKAAQAVMGEQRLAKALDFPLVENEISLLHRSVMGVHVLELSISKPAEQPAAGPLESSPDMEEASAALAGSVHVLGDYATRIASVWRIATEVKKTQRRVNALETIFIPYYERARDYIQSVLEENEREEFFRQKRVKNKLARARV